jgi:hypothetical protein
MTRRLLIALLTIAVAVVLAHQYQIRIRRQMVDFDVYRTAAVRVASAQPLYRPSDGHYQFKYLPAFAMAMVPFGWMAVGAAKFTWFGLSVLWLLWLLAGSIVALPDRRLAPTTVALITVVFMAKFYGHELTLGQANALLGAIFITALLALVGGRVNGGAILIGLAVFVKPYAIILWPWLAWTRGRRAAVIAAVTIAAGLILPAAIYGWHGNLDQIAAWWHTVAVSTEPNLLDTDNTSLAAMWAKWLGAGTAATALTALTSVAVVGVIGLMTWWRRGIRHPDLLEFATILIAIPLLSPQGWDYVLLLGTPAVACLADRWRDLRIGWRVLAGIALVAMGLTTFDVMGRAAYGVFMNRLSGITVGALVVVALLAGLRGRRLA